VMKLKKIKHLFALFFALACSFVIPFSSANAGAGEWDYLGHSGWVSRTTSIVESGGGNFMFCVEGYNNDTLYHLYEYDPDNADDYVGFFDAELDPDKCTSAWNIDNFVDGTNDKAEFYVKANDGNFKVHWYD
jgi:hypothetical protein